MTPPTIPTKEAAYILGVRTTEEALALLRAGRVGHEGSRRGLRWSEPQTEKLAGVLREFRKLLE